MAAYDYRCRDCDTTFTIQRRMSDIATLVRCPLGHEDVSRLWSAIAVTGGASTPKATGGCCGGGCCG